MADGLLSKIGSKDFAEVEERKLKRGGVVDVRSERNTVDGREKDWMSVHDERGGITSRGTNCNRSQLKYATNKWRVRTVEVSREFTSNLRRTNSIYNGQCTSQ